MDGLELVMHERGVNERRLRAIMEEAFQRASCSPSASGGGGT